jgi:hypothetical protein
MKMEITNNNYQISNKNQSPITKKSNNLHTFGFLRFEYWNLFGTCNFMIGIYNLRFGIYLFFGF